MELLTQIQWHLQQTEPEGLLKMISYYLPESLKVNGIEYEIREDYRTALDILSSFNDNSLTDEQKVQTVIEILYWPITPPEEHLQEAFEMAVWFLDCGIEQDNTQKPRTMDWEQDAAIIFPAVNKVAGFDTRKPILTHWWTFYGWFMEIDDGLFSQVLAIRKKKSKGKKLEKWEQEFLRDNEKLCSLVGEQDNSKEDFFFFENILNGDGKDGKYQF